MTTTKTEFLQQLPQFQEILGVDNLCEELCRNPEVSIPSRTFKNST